MRTLKNKVAIFFVGVSLLSASCAQSPEAILPEPGNPPSQSVAEALFLNKDFAGALLEYEHDYETAVAPEDRNSALYGLACAQLILARSDSQLSEAIGNLEKWDAEKGQTPHTENRHLLVIALRIQNDRIQKKNQEQALLSRQKNTVIANQKKKITQMATTVDNLQKQLEELETIDETLQEKRKPL